MARISASAGGCGGGAGGGTGVSAAITCLFPESTVIVISFVCATVYCFVAGSRNFTFAGVIGISPVFTAIRSTVRWLVEEAEPLTKFIMLLE